MSAYVRHKNRPAWGVGMLVSSSSDARTYVFADGQTRSFKAAACDAYLEPANAPAQDVEARLSRGLASKGAATPKAVNLELEAEIRARPDDAHAYLVYADWLLERGDPRGDLITTQHRLAADPTNKKLRDAERALLDKHGDYFLPASLHAMLARAQVPRCEAVWRLGFLERVKLAKRPRQDGDIAEMTRDVLLHPSAVFLVALTLGALGTPDSYSYIDCVEAIAKAKHASLRELMIGDFESRDMDLAFTGAGNVSPLFTALPALQRLTLRAGSVRFGAAITHAALKELRVVVAEMNEATLERLVRLSCASLESFELSCPNVTLAHGALRRLLETSAPRLRRLVLRKTVGTGALLEEILASPAHARLESIELTEGDLDDVAGLAPTARARVAELGDRIVVRPRARADALDEAAVVARAPDARSMTAARAIARADAWIALARHGDRVWGEFEGSDHYYVMASVVTEETSCSCASPKDPCKHALALLLLAAGRHPFAERPVPEALARQSRERPRYAPSWE